MPKIWSCQITSHGAKTYEKHPPKLGRISACKPLDVLIDAFESLLDFIKLFLQIIHSERVNAERHFASLHVLKQPGPRLFSVKFKMAATGALPRPRLFSVKFEVPPAGVL